MFVTPSQTLSNFKKEAFLGSPENQLPPVLLSDEDAIFIGAAGESIKKIEQQLIEAQKPKYKKVFMSFETFFRLRFRIKTLTDYIDNLKLVDSAFANALENETKKGLSLIHRLAKLTSTLQVGKTKEELFFEDFHFDSIVIDELHHYKNAKESFKTLQAKYLSLPPSSAVGIDTLIKCWYVREQNRKNTGKADGIIGLTATPFTNSPLEFYSMLSLVIGEELFHSLLSIESSADFLDSICDIETDLDYGVEGSLRNFDLFKGIKNIALLRPLLQKFITFLSHEEVSAHLYLPEKQEYFDKIDLSPLMRKKIAIFRKAYLIAKALYLGSNDISPKNLQFLELVLAETKEDIPVAASAFNFIHKMDKLLLDEDADEQGLSLFYLKPNSNSPNANSYAALRKKELEKEFKKEFEKEYERESDLKTNSKENEILASEIESFTTEKNDKVSENGFRFNENVSIRSSFQESVERSIEKFNALNLKENVVRPSRHSETTDYKEITQTKKQAKSNQEYEVSTYQQQVAVKPLPLITDFEKNLGLEKEKLSFYLSNFVSNYCRYQLCKNDNALMKQVLFQVFSLQKTALQKTENKTGALVLSAEPTTLSESLSALSELTFSLETIRSIVVEIKSTLATLVLDNLQNTNWALEKSLFGVSVEQAFVQFLHQTLPEKEFDTLLTQSFKDIFHLSSSSLKASINYLQTLSAEDLEKELELLKGCRNDFSTLSNDTLSRSYWLSRGLMNGENAFTTSQEVNFQEHCYSLLVENHEFKDALHQWLNQHVGRVFINSENYEHHSLFLSLLQKEYAEKDNGGKSSKKGKVDKKVIGEVNEFVGEINEVVEKDSSANKLFESQVLTGFSLSVSPRMEWLLNQMIFDRVIPKGRDRFFNPVKISKQIVFLDNLPMFEKLKQLILLYTPTLSADKIALVSGKTNSTTEKILAVQQGFNENENNRYEIVIANEKAETGINLQNGTQSIFHLSIGWTPDSIEQRNGRGWRQGNGTEAVNLYYVDIKQTFDTYKRHLVNKKQSWIDELISNKDIEFVKIVQNLSPKQYEELVSLLGRADADIDVLESRFIEENKKIERQKQIDEQLLYLETLADILDKKQSF